MNSPVRVVMSSSLVPRVESRARNEVADLGQVVSEEDARTTTGYPLAEREGYLQVSPVAINSSLSSSKASRQVYVRAPDFVLWANSFNPEPAATAYLLESEESSTCSHETDRQTIQSLRVESDNYAVAAGSGSNEQPGCCGAAGLPAESKPNRTLENSSLKNMISLAGCPSQPD